MTAMFFSLGYEGTGKTPEPEVWRPEVVKVRVRNVAQDRNRNGTGISGVILSVIN